MFLVTLGLGGTVVMHNACKEQEHQEVPYTVLMFLSCHVSCALIG